jgi:hypothetical protein
MASQNSIFIGVNDQVIELTGEDLTAFIAQQKKDQAEAKAMQDEIDAKVAARESALAKFAALGLTADEIASL